MYIYMWQCLYSWIGMYVCKYVFASTYVYTLEYMCMYVCMYVCMCVCMHMCIHVFIHIYACICIFPCRDIFTLCCRKFGNTSIISSTVSTCHMIWCDMIHHVCVWLSSFSSVRFRWFSRNAIRFTICSDSCAGANHNTQNKSNDTRRIEKNNCTDSGVLKIRIKCSWCDITLLYEMQRKKL